ncbi:MAG: glycosyltransferase family 2 protein [Bacteroidota bacterium]|nr:glycosyltransferase family 2 protein [Bacteroidota bacterium]
MKLFTIILNYNHLKDLKETIDSFKLQDYANNQLVVSDNNSSDKSVDWLRKEHPEIVVLDNKENLGWSGGNNVGIDYALAHKADIILLANNDLFFNDRNLISNLIKEFNNKAGLGIIGPQENEYYDKNKIANQGWILYSKSKFTFNKIRKKYSDENFKNFKYVDNVSGSFMLIRADVFKKIGLIDDTFFLYGEDADFSLRSWKAGYASAIFPNNIVYHKGSATAGKNSPLKIYYKTRNLIYIIRKHKDIQENYYYFLWKYYYTNFKLFWKIILKKEYAGNRLEKIQALILGLYHGVFKKQYKKYL